MLIDYHTHILPELDDGAQDVETSLKMLEMLKAQGVEKVIATPHFYAHNEKSAEAFIEKRQAAYDKIKSESPLPVLLGAEVAVERNISEVKNIEKLAIQGTKLILLELPYNKYKSWMGEEIYNISAEYGLKVILAHIHRYYDFYSKDEIENVLSMDAVFQMNNEAFETFREHRFVKSVMKQNYPFIFGSDCHNLSYRKPNWDVLKSKCKEDDIKCSNDMLDKYII